MKQFELIFTEEYKKKEKHFLKHHKNLVEIYTKTMMLLSVNPSYPALRLHKLQGKLREFYSVSINMQYRIIIDFIIQDGKIIPIDVGDHNVYK